MKTPETPRSYLPKLAEPPSPEEREGKRVPRYVEIPALREHGFGPRNLFWGVATLVIALLLLVAALFFAGPKATLSLATALLTFTALFVLARLHVFRQRNGGFLALALVCLLGVVVPLAESGFQVLKRVVGSSIGAESTVGGASSGGVLNLVEAFALPKPEGLGRKVKVLKDSQVVIAERPYLIKAGDVFPFMEVNGDETTFAVRDLTVALPSKVVEILDPLAVGQGVAGQNTAPASANAAQATAALPATPPSAPPTPAAPPSSPEELAAITLSAQNEAVRRYPALGIQDSMENGVYISTYQRIKNSGGDEFFTNPEWPIELAEYLAKSHGWKPGAGPATTGPAPVLDPPTTGIGNLPPVNALDAGDSLPKGTR